MTTFGSLSELFLVSTARSTHDRLFSWMSADSQYGYSTAEFRHRVLALSYGLRSLGIKPGDRVGLLSPSSPDWMTIDLGILCAGAVSVPIFNKISHESLVHEIKDSGMRIIFIGNPDELSNVKGSAPADLKIITFGQAAQDSAFETLISTGGTLFNTHWKANPEFSSENPGLLPYRAKPDDLATIIYTSGSTGLPKGVELTHANICSQIEATSTRFALQDGDYALSVLPPAHIFERMVLLFYLSVGVEVTFIDDPKKLGDYVKEIKPTVMTVVPRILEKVYARMYERLHEHGGIKGAIAKAAFKRAITVDPDAKGKPGNTGFPGGLFDALVYKKLRAGLGGRLRMAISGSARLAPEVARFFINIGVPIYEGYGMTEASPVIACNWPGNRKIGTVGKPFSGVEVKIDAEGQILARGPNVMRGYHGLPDATAEVVDAQGWLHTGDLGSLDDGWLTIKGRIKELFKKSTGEYVPPAPLEYELSRFPIVDTAVVIADNRSFVSALIFPDPDKVKKYKDTSGYAEMSDRDFLNGEFLHRTLSAYIAEMNTHHHHCERIEAFSILDSPASIDNGDITPSMKLRRQAIEKRYNDIIERMYASVLQNGNTTSAGGGRAHS